MKIHEYQAKALLAKYGVPVPRGEVAETVEQAVEAARKLGGKVVVKAQIHAGGRGKGGGVKLAATPEEAEKVAGQILGMTLITHQTGPEGRLVKTILVEETLPIAKELYLGLVLDRAMGKVVFMASSEGGMDIEHVAATTPEKILKEPIEPGLGLTPFQARKLAFGIGIPFLDVGGGANAEQVKNAFRILLSDPSVKAVLINIFGGILRGDTLATGVVNAARDLDITIPIVVRMEGTNVELGQQILRESGFNFTIADGMKDAAEKVVGLAK
jgi:succinyl-CoA synthetase beta subunit